MGDQSRNKKTRAGGRNEEKKKQEINVYEYLEVAMQQLEQEWQRTGEITKLEVVGLNDIRNINAVIAKVVVENRKQKTKSISFEESLAIVKENYILLRLAKKIREQRVMADKRNERWFYVGLDKEEYETFQRIMEEGEDYHGEEV